MISLRLLVIFLIILTVMHPSLAATIKPANISDDELKKIIESDPADEVKVPFWELPLWIKIYEIVAVILSILGIWKFLPIVITKIKSALENEKRRKVLKIIMNNPGISLKELEELTKMNRSTLRFHIDLLEDEGWIYSIRTGKHRLFYLTNSDEINPSTLVKSERKKQIIELLNQNGELTIKEIADKLEISYKTAHSHISQLRKIGVVTVNNGVVKLNLSNKSFSKIF